MDILKIIRRNPFVFPAACVATAAMVFISEGSYWESVGSLDEVDRFAEARSNIQELTQGILDAESGQRGYLLTNRKEYLEPYNVALKQVDQALRWLDRYYEEEPEHRRVQLRLRDLIKAKLDQLTETIRLHDEGKIDAANEVVLSDIGKGKMEAIRAVGAELMAHETANREVGRANIYRTLMLSRIGVAVLTTVSLLGLYVYLRQTFAIEKHQQVLKELVQVERDRLEVEVAQRTEQLTELTHHLQTAREDERNRLARNLHDELGALLTSAKLDAARIRSRLAGTAPEALERLAHLVAKLNDSIALGRRIIEDLRPSTLANLGLVATLEILAREFADNSGIEVHCELAPVKLNVDGELMVYRLVQEALTNVTKYASAKHVWIGLSSHDGQVQVSVRDDGVGFDVSAPQRTAFGLIGMRFRVEAEGGALAVVSAPGHGTTVQAKLPESAAEAA